MMWLVIWLVGWYNDGKLAKTQQNKVKYARQEKRLILVTLNKPAKPSNYSSSFEHVQ